MKGNKGYSLVELLLAVGVLLLAMAEVGALMINSQRIYKDGYFEVSLQENAQQVVQTVTDLMMNTNEKDGISVALSGAGGIQSDVITIKTKERKVSETTGAYTGADEVVTYKIGRRIDFDSSATMDLGKKGNYSDLMLQRNSEPPVLLAEGVNAIYVTRNSNVEADAGDDMFNYKTADVVTLSVNMINKQYSYSTTSEIYLRNKVGTGGDPMPDGGSGSSADCDLVVLRLHEYDLRSFVPADYTDFSFADSATETIYYLEPDGSKFGCKDILNNQWEWEKEGIIYAKSPAGGTYTIKILTQPVNDGARVPIYSWGGSSAGTTGTMLSAIPVDGICTCDKCADGRIVMDAQISLNMQGSNKRIGNSTYENIDLAVFAAGSDSGSDTFKLKLHADEGPNDDDLKMGDGVPGWNSAVVWDNEVFNRVEIGTPLKMQTINFQFCPMKEIPGVTKSQDIWATKLDGSQYRNDYYTYLVSSSPFSGGGDGYAKPGTNGNQRCVKFPDITGNGNVGADFNLTRIHTDNKANGFGIETTTHSTAANYYWDYIVQNGGYIRLHVWCKFSALHDGADPYKYIYDCYGYYFPSGNDNGTSTQHSMLMGKISGPINANDKQLPVTSGDPKPYEYYD